MFFHASWKHWARATVFVVKRARNDSRCSLGSTRLEHFERTGYEGPSVKDYDVWFAMTIGWVVKSADLHRKDEKVIQLLKCKKMMIKV